MNSGSKVFCKWANKHSSKIIDYYVHGAPYVASINTLRREACSVPKGEVMGFMKALITTYRLQNPILPHAAFYPDDTTFNVLVDNLHRYIKTAVDNE